MKREPHSSPVKMVTTIMCIILIGSVIVGTMVFQTSSVYAFERESVKAAYYQPSTTITLAETKMLVEASIPTSQPTNYVAPTIDLNPAPENITATGVNLVLYQLMDRYYNITYMNPKGGGESRISPLFPMALSNIEVGSYVTDYSACWSAVYPYSIFGIADDSSTDAIKASVLSITALRFLASDEYGMKWRGALNTAPRNFSGPYGQSGYLGFESIASTDRYAEMVGLLEVNAGINQIGGGVGLTEYQAYRKIYPNDSLSSITHGMYETKPMSQMFGRNVIADDVQRLSTITDRYYIPTSTLFIAGAHERHVNRYILYEPYKYYEIVAESDNPDLMVCLMLSITHNCGQSAFSESRSGGDYWRSADKAADFCKWLSSNDVVARVRNYVQTMEGWGLDRDTVKNKLPDLLASGDPSYSNEACTASAPCSDPLCRKRHHYMKAGLRDDQGAEKYWYPVQTLFWLLRLEYLYTK